MDPAFFSHKLVLYKYLKQEKEASTQYSVSSLGTFMKFQYQSICAYIFFV